MIFSCPFISILNKSKEGNIFNLRKKLFFTWFCPHNFMGPSNTREFDTPFLFLKKNSGFKVFSKCIHIYRSYATQSCPANTYVWRALLIWWVSIHGNPLNQRHVEDGTLMVDKYHISIFFNKI